jgi:hypothetical protein
MCKCYARPPADDEDGTASATTSFDNLFENDRVVAALTSTGISGTLAVLGSQVAGTSLWQQFHWYGDAAAADFRVAAGVASVVLAYEFIVLGVPWYRQLQRRTSAAPDGSSSTVVSAQAAREEGAGAHAGQSAAATSQGDAERGDEGAPRPFNMALPASLRSLGPLAGGAGIDPASIANTRSSSTSSTGSTGITALQRLDLARATLALQQACYVAAAALKRGPEVPPVVDVALIMLRDTTKVRPNSLSPPQLSVPLSSHPLAATRARGATRGLGYVVAPFCDKTGWLVSFMPSAPSFCQRPETCRHAA